MPQRLDNIGGEIATDPPSPTDTQANIRVARLASGGHVILWDSRQQNGLIAQRYGANGVAVGSPIFVTAIFLAGRGPSIAGLASGGFVVSWGDGVQGSNAGILRSQIYDANGAAVGTPIDGVSEPLNRNLFAPQVTSLASGGFLVVHDRPMRGRIYDAAGTPLGNEFVIDADGAFVQRNVAAAQLPSGQIAIAWQEGAAFGTSNYRVRLFDGSGVALGPEQSLGALVANSEFGPATVSITALTDGKFVVVFEEGTRDNRDVRAQLFAADGTKVGGEFVLHPSTAGDQSSPTIVALPGGGFVVGWTDNSGLGMDRSGTAVRLQAYDNSGQPVGDEHLVNSSLQGNQFLAGIALRTDGSLVVSWADDPSSIGSLRVRTQIVSLATVNVVTGTSVGETITGTAAPDDISGLAGNDILNGGDGRDILLGDAGNDELSGGAGNDRLEGGDNDDQLDGGGGHDILLGGNGADMLTASDGDDLLDGGEGGDTLTASGGGRFRLIGGGGDDRITLVGATVGFPGSSGLVPAPIIISGGDGADIVTLTGSIAGAVTIDLGSGADTILLTATSFSSDIQALTIADFQSGAAGDVLDLASFLPSRLLDWDGTTNPFVTGHLELVQTGGAVQLLYRSRLEFGGVTLATFDSSQRSSFVAANFGGIDPNALPPQGQTITGTPGEDLLQGTPGADTINGLAANDTIRGGNGADTIDGGDGDDFISAEVGNDVLRTSNGADTIYGGDGDDQILVTAGTTGADTIFAGSGNDSIRLLGAVAGSFIDGGEGNGDRLIVDVSQVLPAGAPFTVDLSGLSFGGQANVLGMLVGGIEIAEISGGSGNDSIVGSNQVGGIGTLIVTGNGGDDTIIGGPGADQISGGDGDDVLHGAAAGASSDGNDVIDGGDGNDLIIAGTFVTGGDDSVTAGAGNDAIIFAGALSAADRVDGGSGNDQLAISGNYSFGVTFVADTITNVEVLALLPDFGGSFVIATHDNNVAAGQELVVFAGNLTASQSFTFNGSAETDGSFRTFGGLGTDSITGGAQSDGFFFGPDRWQPGDSVTGGGGANDQLALDGNYAITIGANADVEVLVLLAGPAGTPNSFAITLSDDWMPTSAARTVFGRNVTTALVINGGAESDGNLTLFGGRAGDTLTGGGGSDVIYGLEGNDSIIGGSGSDTAVFQGARASYSVVTTGGNVQIVDNDMVTDGNDGTDTVAGIELARFSDTTIGITSPIILDLDGGGVETLSASESHSAFDMDGDGIGDDTSWFGRGEGLLFLDRDGNGTVSNVGEFSFVNDVAGARSDLEGLRAFDSNGDGQLSAADARFRDFKVWRDRDGDGVVDRREIITLRQAGVRSLSLTGTANTATTALGDVAVVNTGSFTRSNGQQGGLIDAVLTSFSSSLGTTRAAETMAVASLTSSAPGHAVTVSAPLAIDASLMTGSFADAMTQLATPTSPELRALPLATASIVTRDESADADFTALRSGVLPGRGNWMAEDLAAGFDRRTHLMRQDMASFAATATINSTLRRDATQPPEMFIA